MIGRIPSMQLSLLHKDETLTTCTANS